MEYKSNFTHFTCIIILNKEKPLKLSQVTPVYSTFLLFTLKKSRT